MLPVWQKPLSFSLGLAKTNFRFGYSDLAVGLGTTHAALRSRANRFRNRSLEFTRPISSPPSALTRALPGYAARSTLRMFIALIFSTLFTLVYGYAAARSRRAEKVLIPLLDILQSVPVLGFLSITVTAFICAVPRKPARARSRFHLRHLYRPGMEHDLLVLSIAAHRPVGTQKRWLPYTGSRPGSDSPAWELPAAAIGLVWNGMMSFGGGWFFLAASEAISVLNHNYTLPGLGSYVAAAVAAKISARSAGPSSRWSF